MSQHSVACLCREKVTIDYRVPYADTDLLEVTAYVRAMKGVRIEIACEVRRKGEEAILVSGFTRHCFVSTKDFRPMPPPEDFPLNVPGLKVS